MATANDGLLNDLERAFLLRECRAPGARARGRGSPTATGDHRCRGPTAVFLVLAALAALQWQAADEQRATAEAQRQVADAEFSRRRSTAPRWPSHASSPRRPEVS